VIDAIGCIKAHAHRGAGAVDIPAEELVPRDIVSFDAGDKILADGRLLVAETLEIRLGIASVLMAALTLGVVAWGEAHYDLAVATTMGLTTLSLMHIVAALEAREPTESIFTRYTIANRRFVQLIGAALVLVFLVTTLSPRQEIFDTVSLTSAQWGICLLGPVVFLAVAELGKLLDRRPGEDAPLAVAEGV
jgi:P-type Ca2+ transporter type 2C